MKVTKHQISKVDPSKVWKGTPSLINKEARDLFVEWLSAREDPDDPNSQYLNNIVNRIDVPGSFDLMFQQMSNPNANPRRFNHGTKISPEAKEWGGLDRDDPVIKRIRFRAGILAGSLHTWSTVVQVVDRAEVVALIKDMPTH